MLRRLTLLLFFVVPAVLRGQAPTPLQQAEAMLKARGEVSLLLSRKDAGDLRTLGRILSIDGVAGDTVRAYADEKGFAAFLALGIPFRVVPTAAASKGIATAATVAEAAGWDTYPTYPQYVSLMQDFATAHPGLCRLDTLGSTVQGRLLLAVKISDNAADDEDEPAFFYTSTMHGDETGGYVMLLHLIDSLLTGYDAGGLVRRLVDSLEIWINPLANPDGTYRGGDSTLGGATRYNAQSIDLNRNFPDPRDGDHPDGNDYAPETVAMMHFMQKHRFVMSANFHSGAEVVNYPWDTWNSSERTHADNAWFYAVARRYADTVHAHAPAGYMTDLDNGVTNGGDWYEISGGRQDYVTAFLHGREVTIELDDTKLTPAEALLPLWHRNQRSLLRYMEEALYGLGGRVVDSLSGLPVAACIELVGHDDSYSLTYCDSVTGRFRRPVAPGTWTVRVTADGYVARELTGVITARDSLTWLEIRLAKPGDTIISPTHPKIWPNPAAAGALLHLQLPREGRYTLTLTTANGRTIPLTPLPTAGRRMDVLLPEGLRGLCLLTLTAPGLPAISLKVIILP